MTPEQRALLERESVREWRPTVGAFVGRSPEVMDAEDRVADAIRAALAEIDRLARGPSPWCPDCGRGGCDATVCYKCTFDSGLERGIREEKVRFGVLMALAEWGGQATKEVRCPWCAANGKLGTGSRHYWTCPAAITCGWKRAPEGEVP
jgi:hypothetical protein